MNNIIILSHLTDIYQDCHYNSVVGTYIYTLPYL